LLLKEVRKDWYGTADHIQPRNTTTQSAMNMNMFYSNLKNWEPIVYDDEEDDDRNTEETIVFVTPPNFQNTPSCSKPSKKRKKL
jgi:hypothetical protein